MLSPEQLRRAAADAGYPVESYETVYTLVRVLDGLRAHPGLLWKARNVREHASRE